MGHEKQRGVTATTLEEILEWHQFQSSEDRGSRLWKGLHTTKEKGLLGLIYGQEWNERQVLN